MERNDTAAPFSACFPYDAIRCEETADFNSFLVLDGQVYYQIRMLGKGYSISISSWVIVTRINGR